MPDLTLDKLMLFVFAVAPGFIAIQVYGLKCPTVKKDWGNSLVEITTYSLVNLSLWIWWVQSLIRRPFDQIDKLELTAAFVLVCVVSPAALSLGWYYLRTKLLHRKLGADHPTPRGWEHFVRSHHEFWVLFHLKNGKALGGYFGANSYAATYPQEPEIYVEEIWRVDERGVFVEAVEDSLGSVICIAECDRVEFFKVKREVIADDAEPKRSHAGRAAGDGSGAAEADRLGVGAGGPAGASDDAVVASLAAEGRIGHGESERVGGTPNVQIAIHQRTE